VWLEQQAGLQQQVGRSGPRVNPPSLQMQMQQGQYDVQIVTGTGSALKQQKQQRVQEVQEQQQQEEQEEEQEEQQEQEQQQEEEEEHKQQQQEERQNEQKKKVGQGLKLCGRRTM
jgi:hypothetical protein